MKIRLSTQGMSLNVEVPEIKAMMVYRGLAEKLLMHAGVQEAGSAVKVTVVKPKDVIVPETDENAGATEKDEKQEPETAPEQNDVEELTEPIEPQPFF